MNNKVNLAMAYFSLCQTMILTIDKLEGTSLYKHKFKTICKSMSEQCQNEIKKIYKQFDNKEIENQYHLISEISETFTDVVENKNIAEFMALLKEYRSGNIFLVEDNKHNKFLNQLDKL